MHDNSVPLSDEEPDVESPFGQLPIDRIGLFLGPLAMLAWWYFVSPDWLGISDKFDPIAAHRLGGVMILTVLWWLTEPIPIPVTGLVAVVLCVIAGAVPKSVSTGEVPRYVLAPMADPSVYFLLGGMFIGRAMSRHGLDRRIALSILCTRWAGRSPHTVLFAVGLSVTLVSMWISNTAATAMVYPVTMGIIAVLAAGSGSIAKGDRISRAPYASALLLITAYGSSVGGIATPIGTATNVVARGLIQQRLPGHIDFLLWCVVGIPMMLALFVALFLWLRLLAPPGELNMPVLREFLHSERAGLGRWSQGEINTLVVFCIVVGLWLLPGMLEMFGETTLRETFARHLPEEITALLAPILLFLLPVNWKKREFSLDRSDLLKVDWGTMLLFGAGLSLGNLMFKTGLAEAVGNAAFHWLHTNDVYAVTGLAVAGGIILSEFTSNAATAATLIPVVFSICETAGISPILPLLGVTFGASFGSALPVSTPPNAIVYGSGLLPVRRMILAGVLFDVVCFLVIWGVLRVAGGLGWTPLVP